MNDYRIDVEGLASFQRQLRLAGPEVVAVLKGANLKAAQMIVDAALSSARAQGSTAAHAFQPGSIRAAAQQRNASVILDGRYRATHPEILGAEFGSIRYKRFKSWRGNAYTPDLWVDGGSGYVLMPSIRQERQKVEALYFATVLGALRGAFPTIIT